MMLLTNVCFYVFLFFFVDYKTEAEGLFLKVHQQNTANMNNKNKIIQKLLLIKWDTQYRAGVRPLLRAAKPFHGSA